MAQLKDLLVTGDARVIGNNYNNNPKIAFGTCDTAAATAVKVVTINDPAWNLQVGDIIGVKFTNSNTASTVKLNVNGSGEIQLAYNTSRPFTSSDSWITGYANRTIFYQYDGTYWYWVAAGVNLNGDTYTTAKSWTGAGTAAKTATCHDYNATANSWIMVQMVYTNTSASALTLNINGKGAKPIYINGSASSSSNYTLPAAHYLVYYDGTNYQFRTDGKIPGSITGDAATVNGKTVGVNVPADAKFTDTTYSDATTSAHGLMSTADKTKLNYTNMAYATCSTAAGTAQKEITLSGNTNWALTAGSTICIKFSNTNTASNPTFKVGSNAAKSVWYNTGLITTGNLSYAGVANRPSIYMYDGTQYVWLGWSLEANDNTVPSAISWTAAATAAKTASCSNYKATENTYLHIIMQYDNSSASALTLNVNGQGAKPIYINGTASSATNYTLPGGSYLIFYDGTNYYFRTDGSLQANITGTVNGYTINKSVPSNAVFTDNNTTYTFAGGTNGFTVTPSGGSAQTVTVTPSITNNVTGSGTSGYLTKFNGANSITNGPQLGSSTTTYLRNNGTWADPRNVYVGTTAPSGSSYEVWVDPNAAIDRTAFINMVYPIGSIYISTVATNPGTLFGVGTWEAFATGRTLVGIDTTDGDFDTVLETGGSKAMQQHAHTINSVSLTGGTNGTMQDGENLGAWGIVSFPSTPRQRSWSGATGNEVRAMKVDASHTHSMQNAGTGTSGNLQPYIVVYMWQRTA